MCYNLDILKDVIDIRKKEILQLHSKGIMTSHEAGNRLFELDDLLGLILQKKQKINKAKKFENIMFIICSSLIGLCQIFYMYQLVCHDDLKCGILAILLLVITYRR